MGQLVAKLVDQNVMEAGIHQISWNAANHPSGIYLCRAEIDGQIHTKKMTLLK